MPKETAYLHTPTSVLVSDEATIEALIAEKSTSSTKGDPPSARDLHGLHDRIRDGVNKFMTKRGEVCDRSMRQLVQRRKERLQVEREEELAREEAARVKKEEEDREAKKAKKLGRKRSHDEMAMDVDAEKEEQGRKERRESLPSVGAHGLARQDGVDVHQGKRWSMLPFLSLPFLSNFTLVATQLHYPPAQLIAPQWLSPARPLPVHLTSSILC